MYSRIRDRATGAIKWSALGQWANRAIQLLLLLIFARILLPGEYGTFEIVLLILSLGQIIQDFGLSRAVIQTDSNIQIASNFVFWINLPLSFALYALFFVLSPTISTIFNNPELSALIRVAGLQLVITSFRSVHLSIAQRELKFRIQFIGDFSGSLITALTTVGFLLLGMRVWALIYGLLIGSVTQTITFWLISPWRPTFQFDTMIGRSLIRFGGYAAIESFQGWLINYGDNLILGIFLGMEALGIYSLAFNIAVNSFSFIFQPIAAVAYSSFSSLKSNIGEIKRAYLNLVRIFALLILPMGVGLALIADPIAQVVLVGRWPGIATVIQLLVIFPGISHLLLLNPELYRAIGRPDIMPRLLLVALIYSFPALIIGAQYSLVAFVVARVTVTIIFFPVHVVLIKHLLSLKIISLWDQIKVPLLATLIMALVVYFLNFGSTIVQSLPGWLHISTLIFAGAFSYCSVLWWADREVLSSAYRLVKNAI
jgi:O-antigen/teichoic acid export membrane protein